MRPHLSCIDDPRHEFQAPDGTWLLIDRAIVYDGWLCWRDAIPDEPVLRERLDAAAFAGIESLARQIHITHQLMPNYRSLLQSPFHIKRWWDPDDDDILWREGRCCLARLEGYTAQDFARTIPARNRLQANCLTESWIEFSLPTAAEVKTASSGKALCSASPA